MVVTVSDLALIVLKPTVESFAQQEEGISPTAWLRSSAVEWKAPGGSIVLVATGQCYSAGRHHIRRRRRSARVIPSFGIAGIAHTWKDYGRSSPMSKSTQGWGKSAGDLVRSQAGSFNSLLWFHCFIYSRYFSARM